MKRFLTIAVTAFLCCLLAVPCFAAGAKPAVEVMWTDFSMNSVGGVSPQIWYRSNSDKPIKYIEWHLTAYNAVGDPVKCDIRNRSSIIAETVGPIYKTVLHSSSTTPYTKTYCADDDPFKTSYYTGYYINTTNPALYHNGSGLKYTIDIEQLKNNAVNYISHIRGAYKNECLWSTFKQYANKFDCPRLKYRCAKRDSRKGNGCLGCQSRDSCRVNFLACNCRATNKFKDKTVLTYLLNIYPSPVISDYLAAKGYPLDADTYALAQLLQWIWRSAIREDKPVYLYLPSSRLRKLLYQYLNDED